jgi:hypothetical protein
MQSITYIAHRGLYQGPSQEKENRPSQIDDALSMGFEAEIDLRIKDDQLWLGHDEPQYCIDKHWLMRHSPRLWIHCKDLQALEWCTKNPSLNFFWHQEDDFTLTSQHFIWTYPDGPLGFRSISVMPEWKGDNFIGLTKYVRSGQPLAGICSDFILRIRDDVKSDDYTAW